MKRRCVVCMERPVCYSLLCLCCYLASVKALGYVSSGTQGKQMAWVARRARCFERARQRGK